MLRVDCGGERAVAPGDRPIEPASRPTGPQYAMGIDRY